MTTHDESPIIRTSPKRMAQGLAIVVIVVAVCAAILIPNWNQMAKVPPPVSSIAVQSPNAGQSSESQGPSTATETTTTTTEGGGSANAPVSGVTITIQKGASIQGSPDYNPDTAKVSASDKIVWVNEDTAAHTATSGTGATDPDSGKIFDTSIINGGEKSAPQELKGVKEGDEVPYYCAVHPYMTSKLTVTAASAGSPANTTTTTEGNASSTSTSPANATTNATTTGTGNASSTSTSPANATTNATTTGTGNASSSTSAPAAATATTTTLTIPVGASTPGNPSYDPVSLTVKKGDEIDVVNKDSSPHTVTSGKAPDAPDAGKQFDTSIINGGASARLMTANLEAGEHDFHCAIHPFMTGKIIVQ
jgi:plastocyanin